MISNNVPNNYIKLNDNISFPVGIDAVWSSPQDCNIPDPYLKNWLLDTGSLTERLQSQCRDFKVQLIGQRPMSPEHEELNQLNPVDSGLTSSDWQIREVILWGKRQPWVFARSIIPNALCTTDLADLGTQPLGKVIFNDPRFIRLPFQVGQLTQPNESLKKLDMPVIKSLWGRRSVFHFKELQMMVAEIFLPDAPAYQQMVKPL